MTQPSVPAAGSFRVDLDRAPRAIADLEHALEDLQALRRDAVSLGKVTPPARDSVSMDAAIALGRVADVGPGSLLAAIDAGILRVRQLADQLAADLSSYEQTERDSATSLS